MARFVAAHELDAVAEALRGLETRVHDMSDTSLQRCLSGARGVAAAARALVQGARKEQRRRNAEWDEKGETR